MQLLLQFGDGGEDKVRRAFNVLKGGGRVNKPARAVRLEPARRRCVRQIRRPVVPVRVKQQAVIKK
jgi:hypothetical protein